MQTDKLDVGREQELKAHIAAIHHKKSVPDADWEKLRGMPAFRAAIEGDSAAIRQLGDAFGHSLYLERNARRRVSAAAARADRAQHLIPLQERKREEVLARHFARLARHFGEATFKEASGETHHCKSEVQDFRDRYLEGKPVTATRATAILQSPAALLLSPYDFQHRISLLRHKAKILSHSYSVDAQGLVLEDFTLEIQTGLGPRQPAKSYKLSIPRPEPPEKLWAPGAGGPTSLNVYPERFLDWLRRLGEQLSQHYGWDLAQATWFILTDGVPSTPALKVKAHWLPSHDHTHSTITIIVQPWVSPNTVASIYREMQQWVLRQIQKAGNEPLQIHPTGVHALEFFDFVAEGRDRGRSWRKLMEDWNRTRPKEERYRPDGAWSFQRHYELIRARIVHLHWPRRKQRRKRERKKDRS